MGGFQFQESHPKKVRLGIPMSEDDILPETLIQWRNQTKVYHSKEVKRCMCPH
jgi:hypothetical protein